MKGKKDCDEKRCSDCAHLGEIKSSSAMICLKLYIIPMSKDGKGLKNCPHHEKKKNKIAL